MEDQIKKEKKKGLFRYERKKQKDEENWMVQGW